MRLLTKNIFSLFLILSSASIFASTVAEVFIIDTDDNHRSHRGMLESKRLKITTDLAYLSIINDRRYGDCWSNFQIKKGAIGFKISGSKMNILSSNNKSVTYEYLIDTSKIIFDDVNLGQEFRSFCNDNFDQ